MLRSFFNLCLVGIICVTATTIPIEKNGLNMNVSFKLPKIQMPKFAGPKLPTKTSPAKLAYAGESDNLDLENPSSYQFHIQSSQPQALTHDSNNPLILEVVQNNQVIKELQTSDFAKSLPENQTNIENELIYELDLSQQTINLPNGTYVFRIHSTAQELNKLDPLALNITYSTISPYIPATNTADQGKMGLRLFFPEPQNIQQLVPVTRFVSYSRAPLRITIDNMKKGSDVLGFQSSIPGVNKIQVRKDMAIIHLSSDMERFNQNATDANFAVRSFVDALTAVPGINKVKFLVNGKEADSIFHGMSTKEVLTADINPKAYLALDHHQKRVLLVPVSLKDQTMVYENLFKALKTGEIDGNKEPGLIASIPTKVELINHTLEGDKLTLNLSKEFLNAHANRADLQRMMVDSILFSYTSIIGVNQVRVLVDGQPVDSFGGISLSGYMKKPLFINPEVQ